MIADGLVLVQLLSALAYLLGGHKRYLIQEWGIHLLKLLSELERLISPEVESSLQIRPDIIHTIMHHSKLVSVQLPQVNELSPSIDVSVQVGPFTINLVPHSDHVLSHQLNGSLVNLVGDGLNLSFGESLLSHEVFEVLNFPIGLPILSSNRTGVIIIINKLFLLILFLPPDEGISKSMSGIPPENEFEPIATLVNCTMYLVSVFLKGILQVSFVTMSDHELELLKSSTFAACVVQSFSKSK